MNIGDNLRKIRKERKENQTKFANFLNISQSYLSDLENGRKNVSIDTVNKIAKKLNVSTSYLVSGNKMYSDLNDEEKEKALQNFKNQFKKDNKNKELLLKNNLLSLIEKDLNYLDIHYLNNIYNFYELEKDNKDNLLFISVLIQQIYNYKRSGNNDAYDDLINEFSAFLKKYINVKE